MAIIKFSGKPIDKLIETVSQGIGILYEPKRIRKKADAEAYRLEKLEEAKAKGLILKSDAELEIIERAQERFAHREINRQINLESIVEKSTKHLGESVSEEPVDEDWRTRFFNKAQDVSYEDMQEIWGKILAEEVTQPGKISFRTLDVISNLSKKEASLFKVACRLAFSNGAILKFDTKNSFDSFGLNYTNLLVLRSAGLIYDSDSLNVTFPNIHGINGAILIFGKTKLLCQKENAIDYKFNQVKFTPSGKELMNTLDSDKNDEYLNKFIEEQKKKGYDFHIL